MKEGSAKKNNEPPIRRTDAKPKPTVPPEAQATPANIAPPFLKDVDMVQKSRKREKITRTFLASDLGNPPEKPPPPSFVRPTVNIPPG